MEETATVFTSRDGIEIQTYRWAPDGSRKAVVQVQHGLAEHTGRYRRFAEALTDAGYLVYAPDARGSGRTAGGDYGRWGADGLSSFSKLAASHLQDSPCGSHSAGPDPTTAVIATLIDPGIGSTASSAQMTALTCPTDIHLII